MLYLFLDVSYDGNSGLQKYNLFETSIDLNQLPLYINLKKKRLKKSYGEKLHGKTIPCKYFPPEIN